MMLNKLKNLFLEGFTLTVQAWDTRYEAILAYGDRPGVRGTGDSPEKAVLAAEALLLAKIQKQDDALERVDLANAALDE